MNNRKNIHVYHHYVADPLFYKVRPYALGMLLIIFIASMTITVLALCKVI